MSGSIGGVTSGGGAPAVSGGHSAAPTQDSGAASSIGESTPSKSNQSAKDISNTGDKGMGDMNAYQSMTSNMSTQNFIDMHNSCNKVNETQKPENVDFNIKKLIELMIMMKMLQELSKQDPGSGFSAIA